MSKFALQSTKFSVYSGVLFMLAALFAYCLPWVVNRGAGLSFNAYDLAEWASLNPATHATNPEMLPSLLLRMQLTLITIMLVLNAGRAFSSFWWLCAIVAGVLTIAQLPPFEFFAVERSNTNYRQQLVLAIITLIGSGVGLSGVVYRWRVPITILLALVGIGSSVAGFTQAYDLMRRFNLSTAVGVGVVALALSYGLLIVLLIWRGKGDKL